jgi:hypothetical protein
MINKGNSVVWIWQFILKNVEEKFPILSTVKLTIPEWINFCTVRFDIEEYMAGIGCTDIKKAERLLIEQLNDLAGLSMETEDGKARVVSSVCYEDGHCSIELSVPLICRLQGVGRDA